MSWVPLDCIESQPVFQQNIIQLKVLNERRGRVSVSNRRGGRVSVSNRRGDLISGNFLPEGPYKALNCGPPFYFRPFLHRPTWDSYSTHPIYWCLWFLKLIGVGSKTTHWGTPEGPYIHMLPTPTLPPHSVTDAHATPLIDDNVTDACYYTMY